MAIETPPKQSDRARGLAQASDGIEAKSVGKSFALMQGLLYLGLSIVLLEAFFYFAQVGDSEHCMPDRKVGYKPFAGKRITQRQEGFGSYKLNSFGMQNDEITIAKPAGTYRIAVFGDSCVESIQVAREKNYVSQLADRLSRALGKPVQALNFGVSNYSVAQDYLRYQTLAKQFKPDLVIQVYRVDEISKLLPTPCDSMLFVKPVFFPNPDGTLKFDDTCVAGFFRSKAGKYMLQYNWLRQNSRIWEILVGLRHSFTTEFDRLKASKSIFNFAEPNSSAPPLQAISSDQTRTNYTNCYWYMMDAQLKAFARECKADGARFMFLRTPTVSLGDHKLVKNYAETALLKTTAASIEAPVLDLDQALRSEGDTPDDGTKFSSKGHFTVRLHTWVADKLGAFIKEQDLLPSKSAAINASRSVVK